MNSSITRSVGLFSRKERLELWWVFVTTVVVAVLEVIGIASIIPFLTVVSDPAIIQKQEVLAWFWTLLSPTSVDAFLFQLGLVVFFATVVTNLFNALGFWLIQRFVWMRNHSLGTRLLERYLRQPWEFFLANNTSSLSTNVLSEVQQFIGQFLMSGMQLIAQGFASFLIACLLLAVDPVLAVIVFLTVGGAYVAVFFAVRKHQIQMGSRRTKSNEQRYKFANEALSGIKDVKVRGMEAAFARAYQEPSLTYSRVQAQNAVISMTPRYFLEVLAFGAVLVILLYQLKVYGSASNVIPAVGLYAFAGFRLLPKMQAMFYAGSNMRFTSEILDNLERDLIGLESTEERAVKHVDAVVKSFGLRDVTFTYPLQEEPAIRDLNLVIPHRKVVALVGATGSGKTTSVDLLLGLMTPQRGSLEVDGRALSREELAGWRLQCGYVPQQIFLSDDTVAANIAFGVEKCEIDLEAVRRAAEAANIDEFISTELPCGYDSIVGERGVRLSGGQRQRIGIARALYTDPAVLFFDEATSALDNLTERAVMEAIEKLSGKKTLIMVAHRLDTVRKADIIAVFEKGQLIDQGSWDNLIERCETFKRLVDAMEG